MKLKQFIIQCSELQDYLDKYEDKVKFIIHFDSYCNSVPAGPGQYLLVIDVA